MSLGTTKRSRESSAFDIIKIILQAVAIAIFVRVFIFQPFNIPSGSMKPTLLVGDYLFVYKLSYGYSRHSFPWSPNLFKGRIFAGKPNRGDVVVFKNPSAISQDYIKRVIGLPGDKIDVRSGIVFINDTAVKRVRDGQFETVVEGIHLAIPRYRETLPNGVNYSVLDLYPNGPADNQGPYNVPAGHYFMMGDNRDNSSDSRVFGFVPLDNLVGRAQFIFLSVAVDEPDASSWWTPWLWPSDIRYGRFFKSLR